MELINNYSILSITIIILILLWMKNKFNYWKDRNVDTPPYSYLFGNTKEAFLQQNSFGNVMENFYKRFKAKGLMYGGIYLFWSPVFIPIDIDLIKNILQNDFQHFVDRGVYVNEKSDPLTAHLFSLEGKKWKLLRNKLSPTFTSGKLKAMFGTMVDCTKGLYKVMDNELGKPIDIKDIAGRFTTDMIGSCAFGIDCNSLENPNSEFRGKGKALFESKFPDNIKLTFSLIMPKLMSKFNVKILPSEVNDFFINVVRQNVEYREQNNISRKDFMQLLIQLKNHGKLLDDEKLEEENLSEIDNKITLNEIAAQTFIFFEAGFETSSTTMTFCLYELAKNKNIQNKVREEIKKTLLKYDNKLTYDCVMEMQYLEQTINETLRKYPPFPNLTRVCTKQYKIPETGLIIEKGLRVNIPIFAIQRDPDYYPDPEKFDPDRFTEENRNSRPAFTFLPFGEGPRVCIGLRFGMLQTKVGLIALLLNYEFSVNQKTKEPIQFDPVTFNLTVQGGVWLSCKKITKNTIKLV